MLNLLQKFGNMERSNQMKIYRDFTTSSVFVLEANYCHPQSSFLGTRVDKLLNPWHYRDPWPTPLKFSPTKIDCVILIPSQVWWLVLCINLTGLRDAQIASKTVFLGVSARLPLEETSIWISRLSKEDAASPTWAGIIQSFGRPE